MGELRGEGSPEPAPSSAGQQKEKRRFQNSYSLLNLLLTQRYVVKEIPEIRVVLS